MVAPQMWYLHTESKLSYHYDFTVLVYSLRASMRAIQANKTTSINASK